MQRKLESLSMAKLKTSLATTACGVFLMGFANLAGSNIVELAPIGSGYDFVVHVRNVPTYGYNPEVPTDAAALGLRLARQYCRGARVVGQRVSIMRSTASPARSQTTSFSFGALAQPPNERGETDRNYGPSSWGKLGPLGGCYVRGAPNKANVT